MLIVFRHLATVMMLILAALVPAAGALAAHADYLSDYVVSGSGVRSFHDEQRCENGDSCVGWCECILKVKDWKEFHWNFFSEYTKQGLFSVIAQEDLSKCTEGFDTPEGHICDKANYSTIFFDFGPQRNCQIQVAGGPKDTLAYAQSLVEKNVCTFRPAYCCCTVDDNGVNDKCERSVNYDINSRNPECPQGQKSYKEINGSCIALEKKKVAQPGPSGLGLQKSVAELQREAKTELYQLKGFSSVAQILGQAVRILLAFIGSISLVLYIYAGLVWMTAAGNAERYETSKKIFVWTTLGLAIVLGSYLIVGGLFTFLR